MAWDGAPWVTQARRVARSLAVIAGADFGGIVPASTRALTACQTFCRPSRAVAWKSACARSDIGAPNRGGAAWQPAQRVCTMVATGQGIPCPGAAAGPAGGVTE